MIPHLIAVQQDQANGLPPFSGQRMPYIRSLRASAAIQCYVPINGVAGGAGCVAAPRLNAVQGIVRIGNAAIPGKVPAHVLDIGSPNSAAAVRFVGTGHLRIEDGGVIAVVRIIKQHNAVLRTGNGHYRIVAYLARGAGINQICISGIPRRRCGFCRFRWVGLPGLLRCLGDCFLRQSALTVQLCGVNCRYDADEQHQNQKKRDIAFQVQYHVVILSKK